MKRRIETVLRAPRALLVVAVLAAVAACDTFEPQWAGFESFAILYSLARTEYVGRPAGYDFVSQVPVVVERPRTQTLFDFDVAVTEIDGVAHMIPAGMFEGFTVEPGIQRLADATLFENVDIAPRDGYVTDQAVPIEEGDIFAVRTRTDGSGCHMYGKFEILEVLPTGVVELRTLRNPLCNDRNLVPTR